MALKKDILSGALAPGSTLREEELARRHDVSRTPIREALGRLETEGLAARHQGTGLLVAELGPDEIIDLYAASRLLSLDHDPSTRRPTVEVAHEAILREWERLRWWLNESREDIRQERLIAQAAKSDFPGVQFQAPVEATVALTAPAPATLASAPAPAAEPRQKARGGSWLRWSVAAAVLLALGGAAMRGAWRRGWSRRVSSGSSPGGARAPDAPSSSPGRWA